jgi:hypothetical protein
MHLRHDNGIIGAALWFGLGGLASFLILLRRISMHHHHYHYHLSLFHFSLLFLFVSTHFLY